MTTVIIAISPVVLTMTRRFLSFSFFLVHRIDAATMDVLIRMFRWQQTIYRE
jgi:hypothetical protein